MLDDFKIDLPKYRAEGLIVEANNSCNNEIKIEHLIIKLTKLILFKPDVQNINNSLFFSNCIIVESKLIIKTNGINLDIILGIFKSEYVK